MQVRAVLFDYSGTLFRLEEDDSWFEGMQVDEREVDGHVQAELMRRLTAPTGIFKDMTAGSDVAAKAAPEAYRAWVNRDLEPHLHREAYLHVLRKSGLPDHQAEALYDRVIDPASWTPYPDTAEVLKGLHRNGIKTAVVSNIAFDVRPAFRAIGAADDVDAFSLSFEVGAIKPDAAIFEAALTQLGVAAEDAVMVGDSEEADGGARALGCGFVLVDPLPTSQRADGLRTALAGYGIALDNQSRRVMPNGQRVRPPRWLKPVNKVLMVMLRLGLPISRVESPMVLTVPGRKTGKPRSTPVTPMEVDGKRYVVNGYPGADWVNNVRAAGEVTLAQGRRTERVRMVELPLDEARPVLREFPTAVPAGVELMKRVGLLTYGTPDEAEGLAGRCPVFRIDPIT